MTNREMARSTEEKVHAQQQSYTPVLKETDAPAKEDQDNYRKALKQYFVSRQKTAFSTAIRPLPVLLAPYLRNGHPEMDFPVLFDTFSQEIVGVEQTLVDVITDDFDKEDADLLAPQVPHLASILRKQLTGEAGTADFAEAVRGAIKELQDDSHADEPVTSDNDGPETRILWETLTTSLAPRQFVLIGLSPRTPFHLLNLHVDQRQASHADFLDILKRCIYGLGELLLLQKGDADSTERPDDHYTFAGNLMSFEKISEIAASGASSGLPEARLQRVVQCLRTLEAAYASYQENHCLVFAPAELDDQYALRETLSAMTVRLTTGRPCFDARSFYQEQMEEFANTIAAVRLAQLEIDHKYVEALHGPYFEGFDLSYLRENEIRYFPLCIVIDEARQFTQHPEDFLALIAEDAPVRFLAINKPEELIVADRTATDHDGQLELAALAVFRRNTFIFQGGAHHPRPLSDAVQAGLEVDGPALLNVLGVPPESDGGTDAFVMLRAAVDSRFFPCLTYDVRTGERFGSHFDLRGNPQPEQLWPSATLEVSTPGGTQATEYVLTIADYLAATSGGQERLEIIPPGHDNEDLVPLAQYLALPRDAVRGQVPFVWVVDEEDTLYRAAIPLFWIHRCRMRLEYWQFLQELAGVNSYHVQQAIKQAQSGWDAAKQAEIDALRNDLQNAHEQSVQNEIRQAIQRMLHGLLDPERNVQEFLKTAADTVQVGETVDIEPTGSQSPPAAESAPETGSTISPDVWVEIDACTSCSDCIDALPTVFKYNEDKQAVVHNSRGGSYAKIVAIAEKCPARCIHPGLPHDPDEPGLDKLVKRAEKYN